MYETRIDQVVAVPHDSLPTDMDHQMSSPETNIWPRSTHKVIPNFFPHAREMREHYDALFANPYGALSPGQIWELWYVPEMYVLLRTFPQRVMPGTLISSFVEALTALNLGKPTWPVMSLYLSGMKQEIHNDAENGKYAYVYSLTLDDRRSIGGETLIWKPNSMVLGERFNAGRGFFDVIPPLFGQLLLFDDSCPHSVVMMQGVSTPRDARVVLNGHLK